MSVLEMDIRPGFGVGIFELGSSLWTILDLLRENRSKYPHIDVKFDNQATATSPIILNAHPHVDLLFTGDNQRLETICLRKLRVPTLSVTYKNSVISSESIVLRRSSVSKVFGPTYKGKERLSFPGVLFDFGRKKPARRGEDRMDEVEKIVVVQRPPEKGDETGLRLCDCMLGDLKNLVILVHQGVSLEFYSGIPADPIDVKLGITTAEDLLCDLGPPLRVHYKQDERMNIHSSTKESTEEENSYFYNYFQHGIDFLLSGETHRVQKVVLHSNVVGSALFQRYKRCPWEIRGGATDGEKVATRTMMVADKGAAIARLLDASGDSPPSMDLDRASENKDSVLLIGTTTRLLGFDGVVMEVSEADDVLSIVLF